MKHLVLIFSFLVMFCESTVALAAPLIRDAEIENTLRHYSDPVFKAAGVKPSSVKIFIVQDNSLNAYVAGGANLFIHTGLITATPTADVLLGVIAHEAGHIAGGHLAQGTEKMKNAQLGTILTFVLGATAAAVSKRPEAAAAIIGGGQNSVTRNFMSFTRANEQSADQSAAGILDKLGISSEGMLKMFEILRANERRHAGSPDPYMITHPLTSDRINFVRNHTQKSNIAQGTYPKAYDPMHSRMVAKLYGFLETPEKTLQKYPTSDKSIAGKMARAIAYFKMPDIEKSLKEMNALLEESPNDPFFHELKGQILFESGRVEQALASYLEAVKLLPNSPLILADLGKVEIAQNLASADKTAITHLEKSTALDKDNSEAWRLLATAYGRTGNIPMSQLALAEEALLDGDTETALQMSGRAAQSLPQTSPAYLRAQDIKNKAIEMKKDKERKESNF